MASGATQRKPGHSTIFKPLPLTAVTTGSTEYHVQIQLNYRQESEDGSPPAPTNVDKPETYERPVHPLNVTVHDIRNEVDKFSLDSNGFQIYSHTSTEEAFENDDQIKAGYYPETEQLLIDAEDAQ